MTAKSEKQAAEMRLHKPNFRALGLSVASPYDDRGRNPITLEPAVYRSTSAQLLGEPPVGRSALDQKMGKFRGHTEPPEEEPKPRHKVTLPGQRPW